MTWARHNDIVVLMIPEFVDIGASWMVLPPGIHTATLREVENRFASGERRRDLFAGFAKAYRSLEMAGCLIVYLDGSFVTEKPNPGDYDACWDPTGVDPAKIDPVLFEFKDNRRDQKTKYGGEFFPSSALADGHAFFVDYFQKDKETGRRKGIIALHLRGSGEDRDDHKRTAVSHIEAAAGGAAEGN